MTPANSTSFVANDADSVDVGFNVSVGSLSSGGDGISSDFLARHSTDRSLTAYSQFVRPNDALSRYTASAVDPMSSIPAREGFVPTHLQWRRASEPAGEDGSPGAAGAVGDAAKIITNADNLAASACGSVCSRDTDGLEAVLATSVRLLDESCAAPQSEVVGEAAEVITRVANPVGSSSGSVSSCDTSLEKSVHLRDENRVASETVVAGEAGEIIAVANSPADLPNGSHRFHDAGPEVLVSRHQETINAEIAQNERVFSGQTRQDQAQSPVETQRAEAVPPAADAESEKLCRHYCRRCYVQLSCCSEFFACHWCHNDSGNCDNTAAIASDATHLKCAECQVVQVINEDSHHCSNCRIEFADYFCARCKHFASVDKKPFHCEKCGICRYHKDRNFHCDVCNVCLDKKLEGKHKCRPGSGHDECCVCLEDAFSGCHVLPCSHKVHDLCGRAMVQNGIRNCPMCRHPFFLIILTD